MPSPESSARIDGSQKLPDYARHYCVIVTVKGAFWLIAPEPLVEAVTFTVLVPAGVPPTGGVLLVPPGFPPLLPHEISPAAKTRTGNMVKTRNPPCIDFRRLVTPKSNPKQGIRNA